MRHLVVALVVVAFVSAGVRSAFAGETVGTIIGVVRDEAGAPLANVALTAASPAGRYTAQSARDGRFVFSGVAPANYTISGEALGYHAGVAREVDVTPGAIVRCTVTLQTLASIGSTRGVARAVELRDPQSRFRVDGDEARGPGTSSAAGLGAYTRGTVESAAAGAPGVTQDPFANLIVRGGRTDDVAFSYDGVPLPQALVAEPGSNAIGASLETTGATFVSLTSGGFRGDDDALSGVIDEVAAGGVFPAQTRLRLSTGLVGRGNGADFSRRWSTPDLRHRYAVETRIDADELRYGDGHTFLPAEAATYGLALAARSRWSTAANVHLRIGRHDDDLELLALAGQSTTDQYGTPFGGERYDTFNGATSTFPGQPIGGGDVRTPSRIRANYAVEKVQLSRSWANSSARIRAYRATSGSTINAPFFDDLSFPNGAISLAAHQTLDTMGLGFDAERVAGQHTLALAVDVRRDVLVFDQLIPTLDEHTRNSPRENAIFAAVSDRWSAGERWDFSASVRGTTARLAPRDGDTYGAATIDPRLAAVYRFGAADRLRIAGDVSSQLPKPLEIAPPSANAMRLAPERATSVELGFDHVRSATFHIAAFFKRETNLIDVLPTNLRTGGQTLGVASNIGELRARGAELAYRRGVLSLAATHVRAFSSSASQFGLNQLNAPAIAARHLFPAGYVPDLVANASLRLQAAGITIVPTLSYESGYPYGNGRSVWVFGPDGKPARVPNDDHVNPGAAYWFLRDPSQPYNATTNPYIGSLNTPEGDDPNTLRSTPQLLFSLHVERQVTRHAKLALDAANLFSITRPTQMMNNPYLIGPPGYVGGDAARAAWYGSIIGGGSYTLGNGVPTNNGQTPILPWTYGRGGYVPSSYPEARSVRLSLQFDL